MFEAPTTNTDTDIGDHEGLLLNIDQMFDNDSVFGGKISQTIVETPPEHRFVWAHWRQNHAFVAVSTLDTFFIDILTSLNLDTLTCRSYILHP